MQIDWSGLVGVFGPLSVCVVFVVLGLLSRRLGRVTRMGPYYLGFYVAALLMGISAIARLIYLGLGSTQAVSLRTDVQLVLIYTGLPAIAITIAAFVAWRYWSWLLAERS